MSDAARPSAHPGVLVDSVVTTPRNTRDDALRARPLHRLVSTTHKKGHER